MKLFSLIRAAKQKQVEQTQDLDYRIQKMIYEIQNNDFLHSSLKIAAFEYSKGNSFNMISIYDIDTDSLCDEVSQELSEKLYMRAHEIESMRDEYIHRDVFSL